jgi:ABC-2 type transport system permease protein
VNNLVGELGVSQLPFWPSHWIGKGLLRATYPDGVPDAVFYLLVLSSNALFAYLVTAFLYRMLYRRGYDRTHSYGFSRRRPRPWKRGLSTILLAPLPRTARTLIAKDILTFTRDPVQWSQVLIFTGLLAFYFLNLGKMTYYATSPYWRNLIGFFNLAVTGLLLSTFTSRFIFPLLSLEGQKFWILGLCPISRRQILWSKFAFAAGGAGSVTLGLTLIGGYMLELEPYLIGLQLFTVIILCSGVSGIAVGLGARFPEMKEKDPSKIAAGFGGTLNLVASLTFIVVVIATMALPCHLYSLGLSLEQQAGDIELLGAPKAVLSYSQFRLAMVASILVSIGIGALATWLPMRMGTRAFESMEF